MKNEADAEDVAQEAFLKAYSNLANFREQAKFSTWLISIALNEARGRLRRQRVLRMEPLDATPEEGGHVSPAMLRDWRGLQLEALERRGVCEML
jgi:RNA polymerase sigma-70 factor (ECF subfamily)